jgi:hypothetical protein
MTRIGAAGHGGAAPGSRKDLKRALDGIDGWFWPGEAWELHETARRLAPGRPVSVVEIGSFHGRSTIAAALGLRSRGTGGTCYAIDPQSDARFERLRANLVRLGVDSVVTAIRSTSRAARAEFGADPIDLLFIDGAHDYESARDDLAGWLPLVRPGGVIALNDPFWPGVARAIREHLAVGGPVRSPRYVDNTLFFLNLPGERWTGVDTKELWGLRATLPVGRAWLRLQARILGAPLVPKAALRAVDGLLAHMFWRLCARVLSPAARHGDPPIAGRSGGARSV